ncbi:Ras-related protein Rab-10 [Amphibalanus amphitrite]|uniref:Ras-related protein Rab-10 n=1 Tax=Amphibalanus amphitrite TaxID=1232801 RepID=A0A6A4V622_AMPAM|nr:Ras-related protein Rab-10 [Amphibalanus amphitrite]
MFQIAREHGIRFLETSAKANINIERAFMELADAILAKAPGRDSVEIPDRFPQEKQTHHTGGKCC